MSLGMTSDLKAQRGQDIGTKDTEIDEDKVKRVTGLILELRRNEGVEVDEVRQLVTEAYKITDEDFELRDAIAWGSDFTWPQEVFIRDWERIEKAGTLEKAVRDRHEEMGSDRMSMERIERWIEDGEDRRG